MSCFWDALFAIIVWRIFSELTPGNIADSVEDKIRDNIKPEYLRHPPDEDDKIL
jgi:hypothetical protein